MSRLINNMKRSPFAGSARTNSSLLRRPLFHRPRRHITNRITPTTSATQRTATPSNRPLVVNVVKFSRPQAKMSVRQNSVTSLNSQGRVASV